MLFHFYVKKLITVEATMYITVQGCRPWGILADQLTLSQSGWGTENAHLITTGTPEFSNLPMSLQGTTQGRGEGGGGNFANPKAAKKNPHRYISKLF